MNVKIPSVLLLSVFMLQAAQVRAQVNTKWRAGVNYGVLNEKKYAYTKTDMGPAAGLELARKLGKNLELGLAYTYVEATYESTLLPVKMTLFNNMTMLFANYHLDSVLKGLYIGPQAGLLTHSLSHKNGTIGLDAAAFGVRAGCDYFLTERLSVGAQLHYVSAGKAEKTITDNNIKTTYSIDDTSFTQYLLSASYRF